MLTVNKKQHSTERVKYNGFPSPMSSYIEEKYKDLEGLLSVPASALLAVTVLGKNIWGGGAGPSSFGRLSEITI